MGTGAAGAGYVDIHTHVLPAMDDGPVDESDSIAMLTMAAEDGTTEAVATPHANSRYRFNPALIEKRLAALAAQTTVRLHRGCDFRLQPDNIEDALANPAKYTINHGRYLLVEFPEVSVFAHADEVLTELLDAGLVPIVTHPERNRELRERIDDLARWVAMGCGLQVTAGAVTGRFGREPQAAVSSLVARGLVHFVASDAHDVWQRPPTLSQAYSALAAEWGEDTVRPMFVDNPRAVVANEDFDLDPRPRQKQAVVERLAAANQC